MDLHVNVDHVATLRQARGTAYPDPVEAAARAERAGAAGITVHLREDRRHIQDHDVERLRGTVAGRLNLEMAATPEMVAIAARLRPDLVTLVPERRQERTTEGGLDVRSRPAPVVRAVEALQRASIPVSLFIDPEEVDVRAALALGVEGIELHTGDYANAVSETEAHEQLARLVEAARAARAASPRLVIAAGHGLTAANVRPLVTAAPEITELNIGHAVIADALLLGIEQAVHRLRQAIDP